MENTPNIGEIKQTTEQAKARLLKTFGFVPDDKLTWSPSQSARTALQIVAHCGMSNQAFATLLRGEELDFPSDPKEAAALIRQGGQDIATREEAIQLLDTATAAVIQALDKATPELLASSPNSPFGPLPYTFWMGVPSMHMSGHANQIDYIQTIWGDYQDHM